MANPKIRFLSFHSSGSVAISTAISPFRTCSPPFLRGFPVQSRAPCFHCSISGVFVNARGLHMLFIQMPASKRRRRHWIGTLLSAKKCSILLDTVDNSQINVLTQRTMHRICTAATNEEVSFAYRVAIPRQRFRWRNAFSTRWRSL